MENQNHETQSPWSLPLEELFGVRFDMLDDENLKFYEAEKCAHTDDEDSRKK